MHKITVSAPGKLMLFGEHAVLHGSGCIVTAVSQRMRVTVELLDKPIFVLDAPDVQISNYEKPLSEIGIGDIPKGVKFVEMAVKNFFSFVRPRLARRGLVGIKILTKSEFSSLFGFGSSSAVTVCVLKALCELFGVNFTNQELFDLSYKTVLDIQGKGSGFDVAAAIFGGTLYFETGGKVIEPLSVQNLPMVIGYSGIKADTVTLISQVAKKDPKVVEDIYTEIAEIVEEAKSLFEIQNWGKFGALMNKNQMLLQDLGVSTKKLDEMIEVSLKAGAFGAKLSGAGGGDCMIALHSVQGKHAVVKAIEEVGGKIIDVLVNAEGVRIEV